MSTEPTGAAQFLLRQIERAKTLRAARQRSEKRVKEHVLLRAWQASRLSRTHKDLLDDPNYRPAAEFFLSDLYGLKDTTQRDAAVERIYPIMVTMLPERALHSIGVALELDALTEQLDEQLLDALEQRSGGWADLTDAVYADAYRRCDNYALRRHQIDLITEVGVHLIELVAKPLVHKVLRAMRMPARIAGFGDLQNFLERGFDAFCQIPDPHKFVRLIEQRETAILDRIYAGDSRPFERRTEDS